MSDQGNLPPGPVSGRALARLLGVTEGAVRCARDSGRLRSAVVSGGYDPGLAVEAWRATTDPRQQRRTTEATDATAAADAKRGRSGRAPAAKQGKGSQPTKTVPGTPPSASPPAPAGGEVIDLQARLSAHRAARLAKVAPKGAASDDEGEAGADGRTMADIRRDMLLVEEQVQSFDWGVKLGQAVPRDLVLAAIQTLGREFRDSTLRIADQYGPQIAADLGVDDYLYHTVATSCATSSRHLVLCWPV